MVCCRTCCEFDEHESSTKAAASVGTWQTVAFRLLNLVLLAGGVFSVVLVAKSANERESPSPFAIHYSPPSPFVCAHCPRSSQTPS